MSGSHHARVLYLQMDMLAESFPLTPCTDSPCVLVPAHSVEADGGTRLSACLSSPLVAIFSLSLSVSGYHMCFLLGISLS